MSLASRVFHGYSVMKPGTSTCSKSSRNLKRIEDTVMAHSFDTTSNMLLVLNPSTQQVAQTTEEKEVILSRQHLKQQHGLQRNDGTTPLVHRLLEKQIQRTSEAVAPSISEQEPLSYQALNHRANLKAGAGYVPLDRTYPAERLALITLPPSGLAVLLSEELSALHTVIVAGEALSLEVTDSRSTGRQILNVYGPTEVTVCISIGRYHTNMRHPSLGSPLPNRQYEESNFFKQRSAHLSLQEELAQYLQEKLPKYMRMMAFMILDAFLLTVKERLITICSSFQTALAC